MAAGAIIQLPASAVAQDANLLAAQKYLAAQGYEVGTVDGLMGSRTRNALLTFQTANGLPATGELDGATRAAMPLSLQGATRAPIPRPYPSFRSVLNQPTTDGRSKPSDDPPTMLDELGQDRSPLQADTLIDAKQVPASRADEIRSPVPALKPDSVGALNRPSPSSEPREQAIPPLVSAQSPQGDTQIPWQIPLLVAAWVVLMITTLLVLARHLMRRRKAAKKKAASVQAAKGADDRQAPLLKEEDALVACAREPSLAVQENTAPEAEMQVPSHGGNEQSEDAAPYHPLPKQGQQTLPNPMESLVTARKNSLPTPSAQVSPPNANVRKKTTTPNLARSELFHHELVSTPAKRIDTSSFNPFKRGSVITASDREVRKSSTKRSGWIPKGESVVIAGREIGGMVYVGTAPRVGKSHEQCRAYIDPSRPVASIGDDRDGQDMYYWPNYSQISPNARATYLDWLARGRNDTTYNVGYLFLYFYGLERRFFLDASDVQEKNEILEEVKRLNDLFGGNYSVRRYLGHFLDIAALSVAPADGLHPIYTNSGYELPLSLQVALGAQVARGEALDAEWVLSWLMCHPERRLRTPATRCEEEFRALFALKFNAKYSDGLKVAPPKRMLKGRYQAASSEFSLTVSPEVDGRQIPDVSNLMSPVTKAQSIADEAMQELDKFSRYLGRNPEGRGTIEAQALLPSALWSMFPSEERQQLSSWATEVLDRGGAVVLADLVEKLEGARPEKVSKRQITSAADALASMGFGFAPDPRFALRAPKVMDPVLLFRLPDGETQIEDVSDAYRSALLELVVGAFVAQADDNVSASEMGALMHAVENAQGITSSEKSRLLANLQWLIAVPPDLSLLRKNLKQASAEQHAAIRKIAIAMAHADSVVSAKEVGGLEKIYRVLGLDPGAVYADIHSGGDDEPIAVRRASPSSAGEPLPREEEVASHHPILDTDRIDAIRRETTEVSNVLGDIFGDGGFGSDETDPEDIESTAMGGVPRYDGLDTRHSAFLSELVQRHHWPEKDFAMLAERHGLFSGGCLETINEWSIESFDGLLIEEGQGYQLDQNILSELKMHA